jgi:hypothetical protein
VAINLVYARNEVPEAVEYQFLDADGAAVNLAGFSSTGVLTNMDSGTAVSRAASVTAPSSGKVTFTWAATDLAVAGRFRLVLWVNVGTTARYASEEIWVHVEDRGGYT